MSLNRSTANIPELTLYQYQGLAQPSKKTFSDGSWLSYEYDNERNLTQITRSDGAQYQLRYSPTEKPIELIGFDGRKQIYEYDANDQLASVNDSDLRFIRLKRDGLGRIIEQSASQALIQDKGHAKSRGEHQGKSQAQEQRCSTNNHNYFQYDKIGRLIRAHNSERTINLTYHDNGQLSTSRQGHWQLNYDYNALGQRKSVQLPDGSQLYYEYTEQGQLSQISLLTNTTEAENNVTTAHANTQSLVTLQYNNAGLNTQQCLGNGIELTQQYDVYSRLTDQQWLASNAESLAFAEIRTYQYDNKHQLTALQQKTGNQQDINSNDLALAQTQLAKTFRYNSLSQLISTSIKQVSNNEAVNNNSLDNADVLRPIDKEHKEHRQQYQWDAFGNPQTSVNSANTADKAASKHDNSNNDNTNNGNSNNGVLVINDQLHRFAGTDYRFDDCGNQISLWGKGNKQQRVYNALNQLKQLNHNGKLAHYEYDALGRRSAKITELGRIDFIWDNNQLIGEHQNGKFTWFVYQPDTFLPIALIKQGEVYYYHLDQLGTPICITDKDATQVWRNASDAFGCQQENNNEDGEENTFTDLIENPLRFQGQYFDEESNLHYNRFRYYCPKQQRFINQDPIGLVGGINHYQYAPNPINYVDPLGLSCKEGCKENADSGLPEEEGLKPVALLPVEWAIEGLADAAEQLAQMLDTGPTLAGAAAMAVSLLPGKVADKALEPVVKKLDGVGNVTTQAVKKAINRKTPDDFTEFKSLNHKKAAAGEYNAHQLMIEKGYTPVNPNKTNGKYTPGETGIDGIYNHPNPPPDFVITEAKYNTARLGKTQDGKQMNNRWVNDKRLQKAGLNKQQRADILEGLEDNDGTVEKLLIRNKLDNSLVVKTLNKDAKIIGKTTGF